MKIIVGQRVFCLLSVYALQCGLSKGTVGVGVFVAEKWIEKVFDVKRVSDRFILVKVIVGQSVLCFLSVYAHSVVSVIL